MSSNSECIVLVWETDGAIVNLSEGLGVNSKFESVKNTKDVKWRRKKDKS